LTIDSGAGADNRLIVDNSLGAGVNAVITSSKISGMAPADINYFAANGGNFGGSSIELLGSDTGDDTFTVNSTLAGANYLIDGRGGNDTFTIGGGDLDGIQGPVAVVGGAGSNDRIVVDDSGNSKSVDYKVTPTSVTSTARPGQPARTFAGITYDATTENLRVDGTNAANTFDVTPSIATAFFINGNLPAPGTVPPRLGDFLRINFNGITGQSLSLSSTPGSGVWQFASGQMPVQFQSIERFNGVEADVAFSDTDPDSSSTVKVFDPVTGFEKFSIPAARLFGDQFTGGVRAVMADVTGDGIPDVIVAPASGAPIVKIFDGVDGHFVRQFNPYPDLPKYTGGVELAVGDVNGDGWNDIIVGPASSAVAPVRAFDGNPGSAHGQIGTDLFPFGTSNKASVSLAIADQNVNGGANNGQIVVASTVNGIATVRSFFLFRGQFLFVPGSEFQPLGPKASTTPRVTTGDVNGDGRQDIIVSEKVKNLSVLGAFDWAGHPLTTAYAAFTDNDPSGNRPLFITAHDSNGDGTTDFVSAFRSVNGVTGNVTEFSLASSVPVGRYTADVGNFDDLSGVWDMGNGQIANIAEDGRNVQITDSQGHFLKSLLIVGPNKLVTAGSLKPSTSAVAFADHGVLRWTNGANWYKIDLAGTYDANGGLATIQQNGSALRIVDATGKFSTGQITSATTVSIPGLGLTGTINFGKIDLSNGTSWNKLDLADRFTVNGLPARVIQDGTTTTLVDATGQTSVVRFTDPTHFVAVDWGNLSAEVRRGGILFANGSKWFKAEIVAGVNGTKSVAVQATGTGLTFIDEKGKAHSAQLVGPNRVNVASLGFATIANGQIVFDSGLVWSGFDRNLLHALVDDFNRPILV
jgi:hypothetical protein